LARGFTLVEIMVVVVIVGIALSIAASNLFVSDEQRVKSEAERLLVLVEKTRDQAVFSGYPIAMRLTDAGIEFLERDPNAVEPTWRAAATETLRQRGWRDGIRAELAAPDRSITNATAPRDANAEQIVTFLPAGLGAPFSLRVYSDQFSRTIDGDALGNVSFRR
jgi:general secretion pathway protein H